MKFIFTTYQIEFDPIVPMVCLDQDQSVCKYYTIHPMPKEYFQNLFEEQMKHELNTELVEVCQVFDHLMKTSLQQLLMPKHDLNHSK